MNKNRIPYLEKSSSNPSLPMNRVVTSTSDFVLEEDDPQVIYVAKSIAEQAMGRAWDDFLPLNAHDIDQSDLIDFAKAAISALGSPVVSQPQVEAELVHKSSPGEPVAWPDNPCLRKLSKDEPFFVLLGRDEQAPMAIERWADYREAVEGKSDWTQQAREVANSMRAYRIARQAGLVTKEPAAPQPVACPDRQMMQKRIKNQRRTLRMLNTSLRELSRRRDYWMARAKALAGVRSFENSVSPKSGDGK